MRKDSLVFSIVEQALGRSIDSIDKALIEREAEYERFCLTVPTDLNVLRSADFFRENQDQYFIVQCGEYLSFKNLELDKPFVAYTRNPVGTCGMSNQAIYEMVAYKPE